MRRVIAQHYDRALKLYLDLWGEHIHHGIFSGAGDRDSGSAVTRLVETLAAPLSIRRGERVVDLGCGVGGSARWLRREAGAEVVGVTLSAGQCGEATRRMGAAGEAYAVADMAALPFASGSFDVAWAVESLSHVENRAAAIREVARVLKPGAGRVAIADWLRGPAAGGREKLLRRVEYGFLVPPLAPLEGYAALLARAGLRVVDARVVTREVAPTWDLALERVRARHVVDAARAMGARFIAFVRGFRAIRAALRANVMSYALLWADNRAGHDFERGSAPDPG